VKVVGIVQARMGSSRLCGKVLEDLAGRSMLSRVVSRLRNSQLIDSLLVATTTLAKDDAIVEECQQTGVSSYRGDEHDVLDRYFRAAVFSEADVVVRITSDCPLIDSEVTDTVIRAFLRQQPDYASNTLVRTYPRGLDTEVISREALTRAWREARQPYEREHVTPYIIEHPDQFELLSVPGVEDHSAHRWTVDTPEDLAFVRAVYSRFPSEEVFSWQEALKLLEREPGLVELNRAVMQKAVR
jgi:spore coat polysaccharide biosynthesis protein SpsF